MTHRIIGFCITAKSLAAATRPPNIVIIFADDQGYTDVGCFGADGFEMLHLEQLANDCMKLANFVVS